MSKDMRTAYRPVKTIFNQMLNPVLNPVSPLLSMWNSYLKNYVHTAYRPIIEILTKQP